MLNNQYTLGVTPNVKTFDKTFDEAGRSSYSVAGLTPATALTLNVSHNVTAKSVRTLVSRDEMKQDPLDSTSAPVKFRFYINIDRPKFVSAADVQIARAQLKTLVDDTGFWDKILNGEV
jgi:hypothetical protein